MPDNYQLTNGPMVVALPENGWFQPGAGTRYDVEYADWLAEGNTPLPAPPPPGMSVDERERQEAENALLWATDDTQKIAALSRLTLGR
jgi:hypothetical protein